MFWFIPIILAAGAAGGLAGGVAGILIALVIDHIISHDDIREAVEQEAIPVNDAFKYKIMEAKKHSVNVGLTDKNNNLLGQIELTSDEGVSDEVLQSVGQEYRI